MTQTDPALQRARTHVKTVRDFFYHLMVYVFLGALLVVIDKAGGADAGFFGLDFANWVLLFWGLGVVGHAIYAYFGDHRVRKVYQDEKARELSNR